MTIRKEIGRGKIQRFDKVYKNDYYLISTLRKKSKHIIKLLARSMLYTKYTLTRIGLYRVFFS